jgi:hypothetical protein
MHGEVFQRREILLEGTTAQGGGLVRVRAFEFGRTSGSHPQLHIKPFPLYAFYKTISPICILDEDAKVSYLISLIIVNRMNKMD